jgi:prepilin-type N-terminal cleavage/methylation domain-containing protein
MNDRGVQSARPHGFTLIELLTVIVIVASVTGALLVNASSMTEAAELRAVVAGAVDLDQRGRLLARSSAEARLVIDRDQRELLLVDLARGETVSRIDLPLDVVVRLVIDGTATDEIRIDRRGQSVDYELSATRGERTHRVRVHGLTGFAEAVEP